MKSRILLSLTLIAIFILMASSVSAQPPRVNVMPGNEPGLTYAYTWSGQALVIWGNVHDGTPPYTYEWNFGDGSPVVSGSVTDPKYINVTHTYVTAGPKQAVLTVTDASMLSDQDIVEIEVAPIPSDSVRVNAAVEDGLRYLYLHQQPDGRWTDYGCDDATTALAILAFENQGHLPINVFDEDIYAEYVKAGLDYLTSILNTQTMSVQGAGDPEEVVPGNTDNNGIGVYPVGCYQPYEIGMVMMAMVGSGPLELGADTLMVAPNGPAGIVGRTYRELVVDMVDYCAWAQNEPGTSGRGGWRYGPNYSSSDNSVSQWPAIGLEAAETNWEISAPGFVKSELEIWINYSQISGGAWDGAFWYEPTWWAYGPMGVTGAGLCEMAYCDIPQSDSRFQRALSALEYGWETQPNRGFNYGMYAIAKGCRIAVDDFGELSEVNYIGSIEWYSDYTSYLLGIQNANGLFPATSYGYGIYMDHSWALLVLQKTVVGDRPVAVIDGPSSVPPNFAFDLDGSGSYHMDPDKNIVEWLWDFDKSDGIDWDNPDAIGSIAEGVSYSLSGPADTFVVTLRVADDSDPEMTDIAEHIIIVNFENHPPIADAGGPYAGKVGELICFDGTGSVDPDTAVGDYIASYAWDIDGDGEFDDCFDSICCHSWSYEYSGYIGLVVTDSYGGESADTTHVTVYVSEYDVYLTASDISFSIPHPQPGDAITISAVIHCDTASDPISDDIMVRFYDGDPDIAVHQIGDDQIIPGMTAGDAIAVEVDYVVGDTCPRDIYVRVDPRDELEEYNEDNNEAFKDICRPGIIPTNQWINVYCDYPELNGVPIAPGDIITAYDPDGVLCGMDVVRADGSFGFMPIYRDDPNSDVDEGAEPGDVIAFKINGEEVFPEPPVVWTANGHSFELCTFTTERCVEIFLHEGWNLISWNVAYSAGIDEIMAQLAKCTCVEVILSFDQGALTYDPDLPEFSTLLEVDYYRAYWFKMNCNATLEICGFPIGTDEGIVIYSGWNLVSYWPDNILSVEEGFESILDNLLVALGYDYGGLTWLPGDTLFNTLTELKPLFGYWAKSSADDMLAYPGFNPVVAAPKDESGSQIAAAGVVPSRSWMSLYGSGITLDGAELASPSLIEAYTHDGVLCGSGHYTDGLLKFTPVYGYDPMSEVTANYPKDGDPVTLYVNGTRVYSDVEWAGHSSRIRLDQVFSTAAGAGLVPDRYALLQNYPNPFNPTTEIAFTLPVASRVSLEIYNVLGQRVTTLAEGVLEAGEHVFEWDGSEAASGVYFYRLQADDFVDTKKMMLLK